MIDTFKQSDSISWLLDSHTSHDCLSLQQFNLPDIQRDGSNLKQDASIFNRLHMCRKKIILLFWKKNFCCWKNLLKKVSFCVIVITRDNINILCIFFSVFFSYNPVSLGIQNIRALNMSRGGKEGNNAFVNVRYLYSLLRLL